MPPYATEYRGGLPRLRMSGRCFSASSSHVVTCARMSLTDQAPVTPGSISCGSDKPAYDALNVSHALSSHFSSCRLSTVTVVPIFRPHVNSLWHPRERTTLRILLLKPNRSSPATFRLWLVSAILTPRH